MGLADKLKRAVASNFLVESQESTTPSSAKSPRTTASSHNNASATNAKAAWEKAGAAPPSLLKPKGITALQVAEMIGALPESMPTRSKRLTVRAAIDSQSDGSGVKAEHLLAEATLNKIQVTQKLQQRETEYESLMSQLKKVMADYETEQVSLQEQLEAYSKVVHFLSSEVGTDNTNRTAASAPFAPQSNFSTTSREESKSNLGKDESELPPHLRDGEVRKLLGIA